MSDPRIIKDQRDSLVTSVEGLPPCLRSHFPSVEVSTQSTRDTNKNGTRRVFEIYKGIASELIQQKIAGCC